MLLIYYNTFSNILMFLDFRLNEVLNETEKKLNKYKSKNRLKEILL